MTFVQVAKGEKKMRLIDADALIDDINEIGRNLFNDIPLFRIIHNAPTIEAEPVRHGTWETSFVYDQDGNKLYIHFHRECGFEYRNYLEDERPYCPHCGAKMDGGVSDEGCTQQNVRK
jgi:hypothetical protein